MASETKNPHLHVRLLTLNFDKTFLFYRDIMGFTVTWGNLGNVYAHFALPGGGELALFNKQLMFLAINEQAKPASPEQDHFMLCITVDDVDAYYKRLQAKGVAFITEPEDHKDWGMRSVYLRDPEGNLVELNTELPKTDLKLQEGKTKNFGCCGLNCAECAAFLATAANDDAMRAKTAAEWSVIYHADIKPEQINCMGCMADGVKFTHCANSCEMRKCCISKNVQNCADCQTYPCNMVSEFHKIAPAAKTNIEQLKQLRS